jgi:hypothetical protein
MPKPEDVNPHNFKVDRVLFTRDGFSVAWGTWESGPERRMGMRWDGDDAGGDKGYPKTFGHPVWFIIQDELALPFMKALLGCEGAADVALIEVMAEQIRGAAGP